MTNGYIVLTKGEPNLYKHAVEAITLGKPIYYADGNKVAFVNSIELVSTDVVIKTSDTQITVASDDIVSEVARGLYKADIEFELQDAVEETICYASVSIISTDREMLDNIVSISDLKQYLIDNGYTESAKALTISAGKYISVYVNNNVLELLDSTTGNTVNVNDNSNYDNKVIVQLI